MKDTKTYAHNSTRKGNSFFVFLIFAFIIDNLTQSLYNVLCNYSVRKYYEDDQITQRTDNTELF